MKDLGASGQVYFEISIYNKWRTGNEWRFLGFLGRLPFAMGLVVIFELDRFHNLNLGAGNTISEFKLGYCSRFCVCLQAQDPIFLGQVICETG